MQKTKEQIRQILLEMRTQQIARSNALTDRCCLTEYAGLTRTGWQNGAEVVVWTDALQEALRAHEVVQIPASEVPYYLDGTVRIPSHRRIEAEGAEIRLMEGVTVLMLRNAHTQDGTHAPVSGADRDENITIIGGRWSESHTRRAGYGKSGCYDGAGCFGVSTCMLFNNITGVMLKNMTFAHTAGFAVQMGDIADVVAEELAFDSCYADGLHINGNTERVWIRGLRGQVGDDLLALNMYDWQNSSVNFGPGRMIWAEDVETAPDSRYKAMRLEPGVYTYDDGSTVDCGLYNTVIRGARGIRHYKLYLQTPPYRIGVEHPERGAPGSADNLFFEDLDIDLVAPGDNFGPYKSKDPLLGRFGAFEVGAKVGRLTLTNVRLTLHPDQPLSRLMTVGPKSTALNGKEVFDPYVDGSIETLVLEQVTVNGAPPADPWSVVEPIVFEDIHGDGRSSGRGWVNEIIVK